MEPQPLELFRWLIPGRPAPTLAQRLRLLEDLATEHAGPALHDPVIQEHAVAYWLHKEAESAQPEACVVSLTVIAPTEAGSPIMPAIERHLPSSAAPQERHDAQLVLHPIAAEYRRGLREATDIALDLHESPAPELRRHQCALIELACTPTDPRFGLHGYLEQHSPAYRTHAALAHRASNPWKHEEFWARVFTPGPAVDLNRPLLTLWNIVLGLTPRRWTDPAKIGASMGIECG